MAANALSRRTRTRWTSSSAPIEEKAQLDELSGLLVHLTVRLQWLGAAGMLVTLLVSRHDVQRSGVAVLAGAAVLAATTVATVLEHRDRAWLLHPGVVVLELAVAAAVQAADGWVLGPTHAFSAAPLGSVWPLGALILAGLAWTPAPALGAGLAIGAARLLGSRAPDLNRGVLGEVFHRGDSIPKLGPTLAGLLFAGSVAYGASLLRRGLRQVENAAVRRRVLQEVAAQLHDTVLQSLAYIRRRAADPEIARLARDTDTELRAYLTLTGADSSNSDLRSALVNAARRAAHQLDCPLQLAIDDELPSRGPDITAAVTGAVTEAVTNAAKHGAAEHCTVFAIGDNTGITVTVTDDGQGFDPDTVPAGGGLDQSIRARLREAGGTATITSQPGHGTTVSLWIP